MSALAGVGIFTADWFRRYVLDQILSGEATETVVERIHDYLTTMGEDIRAGKVKLDEFIIFKVSWSDEDFYCRWSNEYNSG